MVDAVRLYGSYLSVSVRSQMQYRASFILSLVGQAFTVAVEFAAVLVLFDRFGRLDDWTLYEVAFFYGLANLGFAVADAIGGEFARFGAVVREGEFDRMLVRPRSPMLQLAGSQFEPRRFGRLIQGAVILGWGAAHLDVGWGLANLSLLAFATLGGTALFYALFLVQATICFWTVQTLELMNTMTYGGIETAQYPIAIYTGWFRRFFTFIVPLACISYFPAVAIIGRPEPLGTPFWLQCAAPSAGFVFLGFAAAFWRFGVRHYASTGS